MPLALILVIMTSLKPARQGDRSAMDLLLKSYEPELLKVARARLPRWLFPKLGPEDLVQDCLLAALTGIGDFRGESPDEFNAWMLGILDNQILHHERKLGAKKRDWKREQPLATTGGAPDVPASSSTSILGRIVRKEDLDQLKVAIGWCAQEDRDVIHLRFYEEKSHAEIATTLGISYDAARQRSCRAVRCLGEALRLQELLTRRRVPLRKQDVIGIHLFQELDATTLAHRLQLTNYLVDRWLEEASPLIREFSEEKP
jgi:RNA polymerase sigma-70 factor, ECF subfamily